MSDSDLNRKIIRELNLLLTELYTEELIVDHNYFSEKQTSSDTYTLSFSGKTDASTILYDKNASTEMIMKKLLSDKQYSILMYDKSIIQLEYIIEANRVICSRLMFIKKHNQLLSREDISVLDSEMDDWFEWMQGVPTLLRFDYDSDTEKHKECEHPISHLTISNNESCRIPVKKALSVSEFVGFVLYHFYGYSVKTPIVRYNNSSTISRAEQKMIHLAWS